MINVYEFYNDSFDRINKEENGYLKTEQFNRLIKFSSVQLQSDLVQELQNRPDRHQYVYDVLMPFNVRTVLPVSMFGIILKPDDYEHFSALRVIFDHTDTIKQIIDLNNLLCDEDDPTIDRILITQQIDQLAAEERFTDLPIYPHDKMAKRLTSQIPGKRPTVKKPVGEYAPLGWKVYPSATASALLLYYRKPAEAKLVMTVDQATGDVVYDSLASINIEWSEKAKEDLLKRIVKDFAIYIREPELFQMMEAKQNRE